MDAQILHDDQLVIGLNVVLKAKVQLPRLGSRGLDDLELFQLLAAALGHLRRGGAHKIAVHVVLQFGSFFYSGVMQLLLALVSGLALGQIGRVVAAVGLDALAAQLPNAGADGVEEVAVMADNEHRTAVGFQIIFEPLHRFQVQMVRRLVQNQQVGALQQQPCQTQPGLLTARKHARQLCPGVGGKPHAVKHLFDLGVHVISVHRVDDSGAVGDFFGQFRIVRVCGQLLLQRVHLLHGVKRRGKDQPHCGIDVQRRVQPGVLLKVAGGHAGAERGISGVGQALAAEDPQKRRLAGAVGTDDADTIPALDTCIYITQYLVFAEALA